MKEKKEKEGKGGRVKKREKEGERKRERDTTAWPEFTLQGIVMARKGARRARARERATNERAYMSVCR